MKTSHSSQHFKIRKSPTKLQLEYANKLKLMDHHLQRKQQGTISQNNAFKDAIKLLAIKSQTEQVEQIAPFTSKTVIFDRPSIRRLVIRQQAAPQNQQFVLHVISHIPIKLVLKVNDQQSKTYAMQGNKAVPIGSVIKQVFVSLQMEKVGLFFSVKLLLNLMQIEHESPLKRRVTARPKIDQQLNEFLLTTRGKSFQILRSRSLARLQQIQMRKTTLSSMNRKNLVTAQTKSQLQLFQRQKLLYLKHVRKMSPERVGILHKNKEKYYSSKKEQMAHLSNIVLIAKLAMYLRSEALIRIRKDIRIIKTTMLCMDFIRIIKNKFKLKMTEKARSRMVMFHSLQFLPLLIWPTTIKKAKKTLYEGLMPFMDFRMLEELLSNSQYYIQKIKVLQHYFRRKSQNYRERTFILIERLSSKLKIDLTQDQKMAVCIQYIKRCIKISKALLQFYSNKDVLVQMILDAS